MSPRRRGFSLLGLLISMVCMVVLGVLLMSSLNNATTGAGNARTGTVRSMQDKINLAEIGKVLVMAAQSDRDRLPTPRQAAGSRDRSLNTTANFWSLMVAQHSIPPTMLISGNEYSPYVWPDENYDVTAYNPAAGVFWDPLFKADLDVESNVSFAHMPFVGLRYESHWMKCSMSSRVPLVGNRGPRDGKPNPQSMTYGRDGTWGGHMLFGDGHVDFFDSFTPGLSYESRGTTYPDNLFAFDDGPEGADAMLTFVRRMISTGPEIQHD